MKTLAILLGLAATASAQTLIGWNNVHKEYGESGSCLGCHGADMRGTLLSRDRFPTRRSSSATMALHTACRCSTERTSVVFLSQARE